MRDPRHYFLRRTIILGTSVFAASVLAGIVMMFWREYGTDLPKMPASIAYRLLLQATAGPIYMALAFLLPITLPVMLVLVIMAYIGSQLKRIWLSLAAFLLMGLYWLWIVKLIPSIKSTWKVISILVVAGQLFTNVVSRHLTLAGKTDLSPERT